MEKVNTTNNNDNMYKESIYDMISMVFWTVLVIVVSMIIGYIYLRWYTENMARVDAINESGYVRIYE